MTASRPRQPDPQAATIANTIIANGQLFCAFASEPGAVAACPIVNGIKGFPVSPPANPVALAIVATTAPDP